MARKKKKKKAKWWEIWLEINLNGDGRGKYEWEIWSNCKPSQPNSDKSVKSNR